MNDAEQPTIAMNDKNTLRTNKETARGLSAQAWCTPLNSNKEMDTELAEAFADILLRETLQLRKERDEARRERDETRREFCEVCAPEWGLPSPKWLAEDKGWDCYKETQ